MGSGKSKPTAKAPAAASTSTPSRGQNVAQVIEHKQVVLPAPDSGGKQSTVSRNSPAPAAREAGDTALLFEAFRQALRVSPSDGWKQLVKGETVSVYSNVTNKVPFPTTCVLCKFQCPVPPAEVVRHLQDLKARRERDFFFKEGKAVGEKTKTKLNFQAVMKTLSASEERTVLVNQQVDVDSKGNWTIVEVPEGSQLSQDLSGFTFPSFFIQAEVGGSQSSVVALYRFDVRKVWREKASEPEDKLAEALSERFSEFAQHTCISLLMLGGGGEGAGEPPTPEPKPRVQVHTPVGAAPGISSPLPARRQLQEPVTPVGSSSPSPSKTPGGGKTSAVGDLIEGTKYRWKKGELIGHGAIGKVYMGLNFETGEMMAVKQVQLLKDLGAQAADEIKAMDQEIHIFSMISHPNLVRYYGMEKTETELYIFLEYVSGGSISQMLRKFGAFSETMVGNFAAQIVDGLDYLHSQQICHRDIKAANILYSNEGVVKLADFGTSKKIADVANMSVGLKSLVGTPYMMAPEVIRQTGHSLPADIWSLACVIWEMATTKHPFTQYTDRMVAMYNIAHAKTPPEPPDVLSDTAKDFVRRCMQIEAKKRATTTELLAHKFIAKVERKTNIASPTSLAAASGGATSLLRGGGHAQEETPAMKHDLSSGHHRELSLIVEDEERESNSRVDSRHRQHSRERSSGASEWGGAGASEWGDSSVDTSPAVPRAGGKHKKREEREKSRRPQEMRGYSTSPPARLSILDDLPPDPFKGGKLLPAGMMPDLSSSDEDELDSPPQKAAASVKSPKRASASRFPDPEEEDADGYTREQCKVLDRPFVAVKPGVSGKIWGRAENSDSDSGSESNQSKPATAKGPPPKANGFRAQYDFSSGSEDSD